jgi:hypothetical protein
LFEKLKKISRSVKCEIIKGFYDEEIKDNYLEYFKIYSKKHYYDYSWNFKYQKLIEINMFSNELQKPFFQIKK